MLESDFWGRTLRGPLSKYGHVDRIESHATSIGRPDVNICTNKGIVIDIELKSCLISNVGKRLKMRPSQKRWFKDRCAANGRCFVLARVEYAEKNRPEYILIPGHVVHYLEDGDVLQWKSLAIVVWEWSLPVVDLIEIIENYEA